MSAESDIQVAPSPAEPAEAAEIPATPPPAEEKPASKRFDFRHPVFLSSAEWRKIRVEVNEFAEGLGAMLSTYLRLEFSVQVAKIDTTTFSDFVAALPASTHLTLFKLEPLRGVSLMEIRPGIGLGIVDRLLGGPGKPATLDRALTEMEIALMDQLVQLALAEWCKQWKRFQELRAEISGHETNPKFLQCAGRDTVMLVLTLESRMGECTGPIQLALPYTAFEAVLARLTETEASAAASAPARPVRWNQNLDLIPIQLKAQCPPFKLAARELLNLKVGEFLSLQNKSAEQVELRVGNFTKFRGRLGMREDKWAVQITEISKV